MGGMSILRYIAVDDGANMVESAINNVAYLNGKRRSNLGWRRWKQQIIERVTTCTKEPLSGISSPMLV